jgi:hypothetical protein
VRAVLRRLRQAHTISGAHGVNYFPHLSKTKGAVSVTQARHAPHFRRGVLLVAVRNPLSPRACAQERAEGHNPQGRDSTAQYFYRSSMSDPEYSMGDRRPRTIPRGLVTPTVHVAEGALPAPSCANIPKLSSSSVPSSSELRFSL